jgi:hypothetical protein
MAFFSILETETLAKMAKTADTAFQTSEMSLKRFSTIS